MPDASAMARLVREVEDKLMSPVERYYAALDAARTVPSDSLSRLFHGVSSLIQSIQAKNRLSSELREALQNAHIYAAVVGNDNKPLNFSQQAEVMKVIAEQESYLNGFLRVIGNMSREEALNRIRKYVAAVLQTVSAIMVLGMPKLPIRPGDPRLDCKNYCKCFLEIRPIAGDGNWDVYWMLSPAEHCESCKALNKLWSPLRIRDGKILNLASMEVVR